MNSIVTVAQKPSNPTATVRTTGEFSIYTLPKAVFTFPRSLADKPTFKQPANRRRANVADRWETLRLSLRPPEVLSSFTPLKTIVSSLRISPATGRLCDGKKEKNKGGGDRGVKEKNYSHGDAAIAKQDGVLMVGPHRYSAFYVF